MCGLTGVIFGQQKRSKEDYQEIKQIFTSLFLFSEQRGHHASGLATLNIDGEIQLFKAPEAPSNLINYKDFDKVLNSVSNKTTLLIGHSRWKTVGSELNNRNNQPIVAGSILGTHNGTIHNATFLFRKYNLKRFAEVDSEILFRMADASTQGGAVNVNSFKDHLSDCEGSLSCVFASSKNPECVYLFKGDKPLSLYYSPRLHVLIYSSNEKYILDSIEESEHWVPIEMKEKTMYQTCYNDFMYIISDSFTYGQVQPKPIQTKANRYSSFIEI